MTREGTTGAVRDRWGAPGSGARYAGGRWPSGRRRRRDPRLVERLLRRHGVAPGARVLDAPCGAGRLLDAIAGERRFCVGLDASASMLRECAEARRFGGLVRADVGRLPLAGGAFDAVVACRLLHHLRGEGGLRPVISELVRTSRRLVLASFWDRCSLPALRHRLLRRQSVRTAHSRDLVRMLFEEAGAEVVEFRAVPRFLSQQTFVVARKGRHA
ncbi:MAG: class I SAM-dependent DNA methyltransferase [Planctomycetota bacterium]